MGEQPLPKRSDIPEEQRWDARSVYATDEAWEEAFARAADAVPGLAAFQGRLSEGAAKLADWLDTSEGLLQEVEKIHLYGSLLHNADTSDQAAAAKEDRARGLFAQLAAAVAFAEPELLEIGGETLRQWIEQDQRLGHLGHYIDELERRRAHIRSGEVEEILGQLSDPFYSASAIHGILADADMVFPAARRSGPGGDSEPIEVAQGTIDALLTSSDRELRRTAWESYSDVHLAHKNTTASCLGTCMKQHALLARTRKHDSCLAAALAEDNIPTEVFHAFIDAFQRNVPTWQRYWRLRRKALGVERLGVHDLKAPLADNPPVVSYEQAVEWIVEGMAPLGEEYTKALRLGATDQRWVDARPNQGKCAGAFSTGIKGTHPFVLLSYTDDVFSVSTLAHELGHSMHSYLTWQRQPLVYSEYSIFVAEVASNFNQALVRDHLLQTNADRDFQIALLEEAMANFHRYFFIMPTLARFELEIHERAERGEALTAQALIDLMADLFAEGYGDEVEMDRDRIGITWAEFPIHLYANFYVYQYGTGISAAHALARRVTGGEAGAVDDYLGFLRSGGSRYPIDILRSAGVDLTTPEPVDDAFAALAGMVDRLETLLG